LKGKVKMKNKNKLIVAGMLVFALLVAGVGGTIAFAQGPAGTGNTFENLYLSTLAQKLGTTLDKLQQAMTDARKDAANQAVKQGLMTQVQADQMLQRESGRDAQQAIATARLNAAAKALGMTTSDLTTALQTKTLLTITNEKKVDVTVLRTAIADAEKAAIDQAVKDGKLTQTQADTMKANIKPENIDLNHFDFGGRGGGNGIGNPKGMGGRDGAPNGTANPNGLGGQGTAPNGNGAPQGGTGTPRSSGGRQ
jgi:hypothetical protein